MVKPYYKVARSVERDRVKRTLKIDGQDFPWLVRDTVSTTKPYLGSNLGYLEVSILIDPDYEIKDNLPPQTEDKSPW